MTGVILEPGPQAVDIFRRLRAWSVPSWRHGSRIDLARATLVRLAELTSEKDGWRRPPVPDAGVHAIVDQLQVLTADALRAGVGPDTVDDLLIDLAQRLGIARR